MVGSAVVTIEESNALNDLVRLIDPILFWTCNYEPTLSYAVSEDALFLTGIQDLYKFAIDTNCVLKGIAFNSNNSVCKNVFNDREKADELRTTFNNIQMLRAVIDHNQSDLNGRLSVSQIDSYKSWIRARIGKDQPDESSDFAALNGELRRMGETLVALSREAIVLIRKQSNRGAIVHKWTDLILRWYSSGTRQEYYRGQLSDYYIARACVREPNFSLDIDPYDLRFNINGWVKKQVTSEYDVPLRNLKNEREEIERTLGPVSVSEKALMEKYPKIYQSIVESNSARLVEIEAEIERIENDKSRFLDRNKNLYGYFFNDKRLYKQLRDTLRDLKSEGVEYTLLPQDFLQLDIERNFQNVQLPGGFRS